MKAATGMSRGVQTRLSTVRVGMRYLTNLMAMVSRQRGFLAGGAAGGAFLLTEIAKLPRVARLRWVSRAGGGASGAHPTMYSPAILQSLMDLGLPVHSYQVDVEAFWEHVSDSGYPKNYAGGSMDQGGSREQKLLEYFVSLDLLQTNQTDVVIDIASEWSLFPDVLARLSGARVYRQDLIYPPGIAGDRIGGSAAQMPVSDGFADLLVLHNAFEHFEGTADTDFIREAWRVLRPGGTLCVVPLDVSVEHINLTDPLVDRRGIEWDPGARVVELPWWHNRFGRFYDADALQRRVLSAGGDFHTTVYHVTNVHEVHPKAYLHFALLVRKPLQAQP